MIYELENIIQDYAWGDKKALKELFAIENPEQVPQAEIWMGAHPKAPSTLKNGDKRSSLIDYIAEDPSAVLGRKASADFKGKLPFLFKVLSAAEPLSIQAHPNPDQARAGYARENALGIELNAFNRNYKDTYHKPELICALTPFKAMNGFRRIRETITLFETLNLPSVSEALKEFRRHPDREGLKKFYTWMMGLKKTDTRTVTNEAVNACTFLAGNKAADALLLLNSFYPNDIGIMSALMLNVVDLEPGQAMFLDAGELHAYIHGTGMEIMANSDNVLRGGLTKKHIDMRELLSVLSFHSGPIRVLFPRPSSIPCESVYPAPVSEFNFSVIETKDSEYQSPSERNVEIIFCTQGNGKISSEGKNQTLSPGKSFLIPAMVTDYRINGKVTLYKAGVPL